MFHATPAEPFIWSGYSFFSFPPRFASGKSGPPATACGLESTASAAPVCRFRQIVLGDAMSALAAMEAGVDPCPTGDRCLLASRWIQVVLEVALAASHSRGEKACKQRIARTHLPHGSREPDLGRAAYSWRTENARLRHIGANGVALDAEGSAESRAREALGGFLGQPPRSDCSDGFLYRADADLRCPALLLRHCTRQTADSPLQRHQASK